MKRIKQILIVSVICTFTILGTTGLTFSQTTQENFPPEDTAEVQPQTEAPKQLFNVKVEDDLISVELLDADFGTVINSIAEKAGFTVEMTGDVSSRKITTKFNNIEIERGVFRLLTLIKEKNYMSHYNTKGMLSKLEIYGSGPPAMTKPLRPLPIRPQIQRPVFTPPATMATPPRPPVPYVRPTPVRPRFPRITPQRQQAAKPYIQPDDDDDDEEDDNDDDDDEDDDDEDDEDDEVDVQNIPYIAPQKKPVFIPPAKK